MTEGDRTRNGTRKGKGNSMTRGSDRRGSRARAGRGSQNARALLPSRPLDYPNTVEKGRIELEGQWRKNYDRCALLWTTVNARMQQLCKKMSSGFGHLMIKSRVQITPVEIFFYRSLLIYSASCYLLLVHIQPASVEHEGRHGEVRATSVL